MNRLARVSSIATFLVAAICLPLPAAAGYIQTNLVSDIPGLAAITDASLRNPWGLAHSPTSPFWVSDQATNVATLYSVPTGGAVTKGALVVTMPTNGVLPQGPTGTVFNSSSSFIINNAPATFIFANLNGTIDAWNGAQGTTAAAMASVPNAVYTGLTLMTNASGPFLLAANNSQNRIDVFTQVTPNFAFQFTSLAGSFMDPNIPSGYAPFNVEVIGGKVYVTYALVSNALAATSGQGFIAVFDLNGNFLQQIGDSHLASPWGITIAPATFGAFGGDLLVGNFSAALSEINAFDPTTGIFQGTIPIDSGGQGPGGLLALRFGNSNNNGDANTLFFTDGLNGQANGLFASIGFAAAATPEPATLALLGLGLIGVGWSRRRK